MKVAVTGGAGFIGSHLAEELMDQHDVTVIDNLSTGNRGEVPGDVEFHELDLNHTEELVSILEDVDRVYHLAANADVKIQNEDRDTDIEDGFLATRNLLEAMHRTDTEELIFTSSSTVYGEDVEVPTPESYGPLEPISLYGSCKLGAEALISTYCNSFSIKATILRLANIIGGRSRKGVTYDFVKKLEKDGSVLEVLGNGEQKKSYLHIDDCIDAIVDCAESRESDLEIYNIGNSDSVSVTRIAETVIDEFGSDSEISYTGGEKGWTGDVPEMLLDISKIKGEKNWEPSMNSEEAVRKTAREIINS